MASETTELTFVRCPSCRSLVPASAARCRICNNALDTAGKTDEAESQKNASRVRQKTMSADPAQVAEAIAQARGEAGYEAPPFTEQVPAAAEPPPAVFTPQPSKPEPEDSTSQGIDPLSAYLQEMEDAETTQGENAAPGAMFGMPVDEPVAPVKSSPAIVAPQSATEDDDDDWLSPFATEPVEEPNVATPSAPPGGPGRLADTAPASQGSSSARVGEESTNRPAFGREGGFGAKKPQTQGARVGEERKGSPNFGGPRPERDRQGGERGGERSGEDRRSENRPPRDNDRAQHGVQQSAGKSQHGGKEGGSREANAPRRDESRREQGPSGRPEGRDRHNRGGEEGRMSQPPSRGSEHVSTSGPRPGKEASAKLYGWLVSYSSPEGVATELREGRFFITSSNGKPSDLVIEHPSVSVPHALMAVNPEKGVLVHDLMSERGLFIRSGDNGEYRQEDGKVALKHGDWLRFGDVEFLVALLPYAQKK